MDAFVGTGDSTCRALVQRPGPRVALRRAVRKHIILTTAILAAIVSFAGACAQIDEDDVNDDSTAAEWPTSDKERIWVDGRSVVSNDDDLSGGVASGACACRTADCFDAWVVDAFGCDVCVAFVCDGQEVAHSCAPCEENPLNQGEVWDGDGSFE